MKEYRPSPSERRKFSRVSEKDILSCSHFHANNLVQETGLNLNTITKNISGNGILFESTEKFEVGQLIKGKLSVPGWEKFKHEFYKADETSIEKPLVFLAHIVRVEIIEPQKKYDIGLTFAAIDEGHRWALAKCLKEKQHDANG